MKESPIETTSAKLNSGNNLTTIERVDSLEEVVSDNQYKCSFDSCSYAGKTVQALNRHTYAKHSNERYDNMIASNKRLYKCQRYGCDYFGLTLNALAIHRSRKHSLYKEKSVRFIKKRKIVQRIPVAQRNATVDNNVSVNIDNGDNIKDKIRVTNNNSSLVNDQIIPNIMSAENKEIKRRNKRKSETVGSTHKSFACKYPNCEFIGSTTKKGLRIHFKLTHSRSVAKIFYSDSN